MKATAAKRLSDPSTGRLFVGAMTAAEIRKELKTKPDCARAYVLRCQLRRLSRKSQ